MLIASLKKFVTFDGGQVAYCATDPFDGEMLTSWHGTIMQVEDELNEKDKHWGLMLACHRGESDVPAIVGDARPPYTGGHGRAEASGTIPCN